METLKTVLEKTMKRLELSHRIAGINIIIDKNSKIIDKCLEIIKKYKPFSKDGWYYLTVSSRLINENEEWLLLNKTLLKEIEGIKC